MNPSWDKYSSWRAFESPVQAVVPLDQSLWSIGVSSVRAHRRGGVGVYELLGQQPLPSSSSSSSLATSMLTGLRAGEALSSSTLAIGGSVGAARVDAERGVVVECWELNSTANNNVNKTTGQCDVVVLRRGARTVCAARR